MNSVRRRGWLSVALLLVIALVCVVQMPQAHAVEGEDDPVSPPTYESVFQTAWDNFDATAGDDAIAQLNGYTNFAAFLASELGDSPVVPVY